MHKCWFKIYELSVRAMLAYAKPNSGGSYYFDLDRAATESCIKLPVREQEENALFDQLMLMKNHSLKMKEGEVISDLSEVIFFADFSGIFDRNSNSLYFAELQNKAKWMFFPGNVYLDFGGGKQCYRPFERSQSMSRKSILSFVRKDLYDKIYTRITLGMKIGECQLSKLYAYNGLMLSGGVRIDNIMLGAANVIVVKNPKQSAYDTDVITVESRDKGSVRKYKRVERKEDISVLGFDGEGVISERLARSLRKQLGGEHASFQIRLPYIKGMLHSVDIQGFFAKSSAKYIIDKWGVQHKIGDVDIILTESMVKCLTWLEKNRMSWADYWKAFDVFNHALYVTGADKDDRSGYTELNYQFLNTLSLTADEFRPRDLPDNYPADDDREWLTKETECQYYSLCRDDKYRQEFFTSNRYRRGSKERYMKELLLKNPKLIAENYYVDMLKKKADKILRNYALGKLIVAGSNRYLSGDLLDFMLRLETKDSIFTSRSKDKTELNRSKLKFEPDAFYAPEAKYKNESVCTLLRNPHISRNEEVRLKPYRKAESDREKFFGHLGGVVMVSWDTLTAERLGGADFDGDMVKIFTDEIVNRAVTRSKQLPLLKIPSEKPLMRDANDWEARFETVKNTFSSRVGQISNAALNRSIIAYNENNSTEEREKCRQETETLAILTGLEIDSAKTGIKPDLSEYLGKKAVRRSMFLRYKALLVKSEKKRAWYEVPYKKQFENFFKKTDWDKVDSNLERLPNLAYRLELNTKFKKDKPASDEELFVFAQSPDWKEQLDSAILERVSVLINDYNDVLKRIRACNQPIKNKPRQGDIRRILYARGQDRAYDADELYAEFTGISAERISKIRRQIRSEKWHFVRPEERADLLKEWLPELEDYSDLLCDFRCGGYRVLGDLIADIDDANTLSDSRRYFRENDSEQFRVLMTAFTEKPAYMNYRDAVSKKCRDILSSIIKPDIAVKYLVALGNRKELFEVLYDKVEKHLRRCKNA